jgi:hypothetical protein
VYVFASSSTIHCVSCTLTTLGGGVFMTRSKQDMFDHLHVHYLSGSQVPPSAFERLAEEIQEEGIDVF